MFPSYDRREALLRVIRITALFEFPELRKIRDGSNCGELGLVDLSPNAIAEKIAQTEKELLNAPNR